MSISNSKHQAHNIIQFLDNPKLTTNAYRLLLLVFVSIIDFATSEMSCIWDNLKSNICHKTIACFVLQFIFRFVKIIVTSLYAIVFSMGFRL